MTREVRVEIDLSVCRGHGRCYELAPQVFGEDERGYGQVLEPVVGPAHEREVRRAEENCPEGAIQVEESPGPARREGGREQ